MPRPIRAHGSDIPDSFFPNKRLSSLSGVMAFARGDAVLANNGFLISLGKMEKMYKEEGFGVGERVFFMCKF